MGLLIPAKRFGAITVLMLLVTPAAAASADSKRQAEVAARGAYVMPFTLDRTQHVFTKTAQGGVQRVITRVPADVQQIELIRQHLVKISTAFSRGDFSDPAKIHGGSMPGLAELRNAKPGQIHIDYKDIPDGGEIRYRSDDAAIVSAVHRWFDAQLMDHGRHAAPMEHQKLMHEGQ